jgi:Carboxylesterase family
VPRSLSIYLHVADGCVAHTHQLQPGFALIVAGLQGVEAPYAVLVWVHGESFEWNAGSSYDGTIMSSVGKVIVVTLNYRLGVLGEYTSVILSYILIVCIRF